MFGVEGRGAESGVGGCGHGDWGLRELYRGVGTTPRNIHTNSFRVPLVKDVE